MPLAGLDYSSMPFGLFVSPTAAILAVLGFMPVDCLLTIVLLITGQAHGMGHGDFKLLAALGAWLGPLMLPLIVAFICVCRLGCGFDADEALR